MPQNSIPSTPKHRSCEVRGRAHHFFTPELDPPSGFSAVGVVPHPHGIHDDPPLVCLRRTVPSSSSPWSSAPLSASIFSKSVSLRDLLSPLCALGGLCVSSSLPSNWLTDRPTTSGDAAEDSETAASRSRALRRKARRSRCAAMKLVLSPPFSPGGIRLPDLDRSWCWWPAPPVAADTAPARRL